MANSREVGPMEIKSLTGRRRGHGYGQIMALNTEHPILESGESIFGLGRGGSPRGGGKGHCHAGKKGNQQRGNRIKP